MKVTRVHLLRHGEVEGFEKQRYNGHGDVKLTEIGRLQSSAFAENLQQFRISAVYSSDLRRCRFAAEQISALQGLEPELRSDLRELNIGEWEGRTWQELQRDYPEFWQARLDDIVNVAPPGGETLLQLAERVRPVFAEIVAAHPEEELVIVGHGGTNRVLLLDAIGAPLDRLFHIEQTYGCHNIIDCYADGVCIVKRLNG